MKKILTIVVLSALTACATYKGTGLNQTDADRASKKFPGTTLADLNAGKTQFEANCGKCHALDKAFAVPEPVLTKVMPEMAGKAHIDDKTKDLIYTYLITARTAPKGK